MENKLSSAGKDAALLTALGAVESLLAFLYRVALSRLAGAQVMGLYQLVMPVYAVFLSVTAVGFTAATANLSARHLALNNSLGADQTLHTALKWVFLLLLPAGAVLIAGSDFISTALLGDARTQLGLILVVPCVALTAIENLHKHFFYGAGIVCPPAVVELLEQFVRAAAVIALLVHYLPQWPERAVGLILWGMIFCELFSSCSLVWLYRRRFSGAGLSGSGEDREVRRARILAIAVPVGLNSLLGNLLSAANAALIPRQLAAGGMGREEAVASFGVLCGMTMPMLSLPTVFLGALTLVLGPRLARASALGRAKELRRLCGKALWITAVLALPSLTLMMAAGPRLGRLLFRQEVGDYLCPLAAVTAMSCFASVLACALNSTGHHPAVTAISLLGGTVQLVFTAALTPLPSVGLGGYVIGALVSTGLELFLCWRKAGKFGLL